MGVRVSGLGGGDSAAAAVYARRSNPPSLPISAIRLEPGIVRLAFAALAVSLVQRRARPNACAARPPCRDHSSRSSTVIGVRAGLAR